MATHIATWAAPPTDAHCNGWDRLSSQPSAPCCRQCWPTSLRARATTGPGPTTRAVPCRRGRPRRALPQGPNPAAGAGPCRTGAGPCRRGRALPQGPVWNSLEQSGTVWNSLEQILLKSRSSSTTPALLNTLEQLRCRENVSQGSVNNLTGGARPRFCYF